MTDKIITNGVDVSECKYLRLLDHCDVETGTEKWLVCRSKNEKWTCCSDNNCHYKQFKRKEQEQECDRLKELLKDKTDEYNKLTVNYDAYVSIANKQLDQLNAENERLKFKLDTVESDYEASEIEIEDLKNKLNLLTTANNHLLELDKYRQKELENKAEATKSNIHNLALLSKANKTLQEIKEIAEQILDDDDNHCPFELTKQILQKISESEVNNG